jgi:hypothetical protein
MFITWPSLQCVTFPPLSIQLQPLLHLLSHFSCVTQRPGLITRLILLSTTCRTRTELGSNPSVETHQSIAQAVFLPHVQITLVQRSRHLCLWLVTLKAVSTPISFAGNQIVISDIPTSLSLLGSRLMHKAINMRRREYVIKMCDVIYFYIFPTHLGLWGYVTFISLRYCDL